MKHQGKIKLSRISALHYSKWIFRSLLFLTALCLHIFNRVRGGDEPFAGLDKNIWFLAAVGAVFSVEMLLRFFPSAYESMGCQKQFRRNMLATQAKIPSHTPHGHWFVALFWVLLNGAIAAVYFLGWIDRSILVLIALFYAVCDMICILFFCPFQTWMMKNKCCGSCRIYNWDYAMMFTPLLFAGIPLGWALCGEAAVLLIFWEVTARRHPERFSEETNAALACANCKEHLCQHKRQLQGFLVKYRKVYLPRLRAKVEEKWRKAEVKRHQKAQKQIPPPKTANKDDE